MQNTRQNLLFVCSRNKQRSLTAEMIWKNNDSFFVKSCGTSPSSRIKITTKLIQWADRILVMEKRHKEIILQQFAGTLSNKKIEVLNIPDDFELMNETLIDLLKTKCNFIEE